MKLLACVVLLVAGLTAGQLLGPIPEPPLLEVGEDIELERQTLAAGARFARHRDIYFAALAREQLLKERSVPRRASRSRPPPTPRPVVYGQWMGLLEQYPWNAALAYRVMMCESRGNANAQNGRHHGLMQIANGPYEPAANIALAYSMYTRRGWQPWVASRSCWARR